MTRSGSLSRRRDVVARDGVIGWNVRQTFFQRRAGLVTLSATTAAGSQAYVVLDVDPQEAVRVVQETTPGLLEPFLLAADRADRADPALRSSWGTTSAAATARRG